MPSEAPLQPKTPPVVLDAAGLLALADLSTAQERTALTGTSSLLDIFILVPGIHMQQQAVGLNLGEYPACAALTTGYVFRVENPATVFYLQRVGRTGHLTTVRVTKLDCTEGLLGRLRSGLCPSPTMNLSSGAAYFLAVLWGITVLILLILAFDWWGVAVIGTLMASRLINFVVIQRRSRSGWAGAREPGVKGDLLILLSQDRWIRMLGLVDDLKAVTSGQWLRDEEPTESWFTGIATVSVYLAAALASNISEFGKILFICQFIGAAGLLAAANRTTTALCMHGCRVEVEGEPKAYERRLHLAEELIESTGRDDWAVRMGMIVKDQPKTETEREGLVTI